MAKKKDGMKKTDAVKAALEEGVTTPSDAVSFIRERFGIEITNAQFSTLKSLAKKRAEEANGTDGNGKVEGHDSMGGTVATPRKAAKANAVGNGKPVDQLELARQIKMLVKAHGAETVREMAALFAD